MFKSLNHSLRLAILSYALLASPHPLIANEPTVIPPWEVQVLLAQTQSENVISAEEIMKSLTPPKQEIDPASTSAAKMRGANISFGTFRGIGKKKKNHTPPPELKSAKISIPILFKTNSDELDKKALPQLNQMTVALQSDALLKYEIQIEGHTDSIGKADYNLDLSDRRASSVLNYLISNGNIDRSRLSSVGYGESQPVVSNDTPQDRAKNRRVTIVRKAALQ